MGGEGAWYRERAGATWWGGRRQGPCGTCTARDEIPAVGCRSAPVELHRRHGEGWACLGGERQSMATVCCRDDRSCQHRASGKLGCQCTRMVDEVITV